MGGRSEAMAYGSICVQVNQHVKRQLFWQISDRPVIEH